jgi:FKBP-type peptidyl-prolyl cis-trans isomerase
MRRFVAALLVPLAVGAAVAGCGSVAAPPSASNANAAVKASGTFGRAPTVSIPAAKATGKLVISTPIKGSGAALVTGDATLANVEVYKWSGTKHSLADSTFAAGGPQMIPPQMGLPGLTTALKGATMGSRIVAVLPPSYGYGKAGQSQLGITATDTMVWVVDLLQQYSANQGATGPVISHGGGTLPAVTAPTGAAPVIKVPKNSPPAKLSVTTLIKGTGPKLAAGDTVVAQYVGSIWRTGKVFSSTWPSAQQPQGLPFSFSLSSQVLPGWAQGLAGVPVGSRVMIVIPPALGYGPHGGQPSVGIKKNDTLVFVIDVLGTTAGASIAQP